MCSLFPKAIFVYFYSADDTLNSSGFFSREVRLDILWESSAKQKIHMKCLAVFFSEKKTTKKQVLFCMLPATNFLKALRVKWLS